MSHKKKPTKPKTKARKPKFSACVLYGDFKGDGVNGLAVLKYPNEGWAKMIAPAIKRLIASITNKPSTKSEFWVDGLGDSKNTAIRVFNSIKKHPKYEFVDGEFVRINLNG